MCYYGHLWNRYDDVVEIDEMNGMVIPFTYALKYSPDVINVLLQTKSKNAVLRLG